MGIIATAGAVNGLGQGITETGQQEQKKDLATHMNELETARGEALERLHQSGQEELQGKGQEFEKEQTQTKLTAASKAAGATREFEHQENVAKEAAAQKRTETTGAARIGAAKVTAESRVSAKGPPTIWQPQKLNTSGFDAQSHLPTTNQTMVNFNKVTGRSYMQVGDKYVPFDATKNAPVRPIASIARAKAEDLQDILKDPLGTIPDGPNAGMQKIDAFEEHNGYIPAQWTDAANRAAQANPKQYSHLFSAPSAMVNGGGSNNDEGPADNASQSQSDADDSAPAFQSNAMSTYGANAQ